MVEDVAIIVIEALEAEKLDHMLVGAYSSGAYSIPRGTKDVDIVISLESPDRIDSLAARLEPHLDFDPQITFETITGSKRYILKSKKNKAIIVELFLLGTEAYVVERFRRRQRVFVSALRSEVWLPTAEDVIVQKLRWARPKDLEDARDVLAVQTVENLDMAYIEKWCTAHGSLELLRKIESEIPPDL
jgi:hypothetical protein